MKKQTLTEGLRRTREIMGIIVEGNEYGELVAQVREVGLRFADLRTLKDEVEESTTLSKEDKTKLLKMIDGKISETGLNEHGGGVDMELYKNLKLAKQGEFYEGSKSNTKKSIERMSVIFNDEGYSDEFVNDLTIWCKEHSVPTSKVIIGLDENSVDGIDYFVITVNEGVFSYLMWKEFDMTEKYGRDGWNNYIESNYNCETA